MSLYADSAYPVPAAIDNFHQQEFQSFAGPGTVLTGEERTAIIRHARECLAAAGELDAVSDPGTTPDALLPGALLSLVGKLAVDPAHFSRADYAAATAAGISDQEYVETVGLVARAVNIDIFARGIGLAPNVLSTAQDGEPSYERPADAVDEGAWLPSIPSGDAGGASGAALYGEGMQPFIYRALSLVPGEAACIIAGGNAQYLELSNFFDFDYAMQAGMSRAQVELVAARVSAHNACFY